MQPFKDVRWSDDLARLSNSDKHRTYVEISPALEAKFDIQTGAAAQEPWTLSFELRTIEDPSNSRPAHEVLLPIMEGVCGVLNRFIAEEDGVEPVAFEAEVVSQVLGAAGADD